MAGGEGGPAAAGVEAISFGCRLNAHEGERARARAVDDGLTDAVIVNTCAVTGEAVRQARQAIRRARRERPHARLVATGCAVQIDPAAFAAMDEVDLVLGQDLKAAPGSYAPASFALRRRVGAAAALVEPAAAAVGSAGPSPVRARRSVAVQNGCDHACTFCIIPMGRGRSRSLPADAAVAEVRAVVAEGAREAVLTGVDLTAWGADLPGAPTLGALCARILAEVPDLARLRLSSIDAAEIDPELLRLLGEEPRLAPYLHLSLQHGDDLILKRMKRRHGRNDALRLIAAVRAARPDTAFGADLIAGFPTESEAAFQNTLAFVEEARLAYLHVFPFSARPGTPAARMPSVPGAVVKARAERLHAAGAAALARHLDRQVGRIVDALVERPGLARAPDFTEVAIPPEHSAGAVVRLRIEAIDGRRACGVPVRRAA